MSDAIAGGCQCGMVRYRVEGALSNAHICHCRMCQKAAGNYFLPLANVDKGAFRVTRGEIAWFHSSDPVRRGFCRDCGTPLVFEEILARHLNVTLGSLDAPAAVAPRLQVGIEGRLPWFGALPALPAETSEDGMSREELGAIRASNRQHPDHETEAWPPRRP